MHIIYVQVCYVYVCITNYQKLKSLAVTIHIIYILDDKTTKHSDEKSHSASYELESGQIHNL